MLVEIDDLSSANYSNEENAEDDNNESKVEDANSINVCKNWQK